MKTDNTMVTEIIHLILLIIMCIFIGKEFNRNWGIITFCAIPSLMLFRHISIEIVKDKSDEKTNNKNWLKDIKKNYKKMSKGDKLKALYR